MERGCPSAPPATPRMRPGRPGIPEPEGGAMSPPAHFSPRRRGRRARGRPRSPEVSERDHERYRRGLDDYHDPLAGIGGAPPARSALTLRIWLAGFGLVFCAAAAAVVGYLGSGVW